VPGKHISLRRQRGFLVAGAVSLTLVLPAVTSVSSAHAAGSDRGSVSQSRSRSHLAWLRTIRATRSEGKPSPPPSEKASHPTPRRQRSLPSVREWWTSVQRAKMIRKATREHGPGLVAWWSQDGHQMMIPSAAVKALGRAPRNAVALLVTSSDEGEEGGYLIQNTGGLFPGYSIRIRRNSFNQAEIVPARNRSGELWKARDFSSKYIDEFFPKAWDSLTMGIKPFPFSEVPKEIQAQMGRDPRPPENWQL
jgi:hypothetical protein